MFSHFFTIFVAKLLNTNGKLMEKKKIYIEHPLKSKSANIIWQAISTEGGLAKWIADNVQQFDDTFEFMWGAPWAHHETRKAHIINKVKNKYIQLRWDDEEEDDAFLEMRMTKNDLTGDYVLQITDFAYDEDIDWLYSIWDRNFEAMWRTMGI